MQPSRRTFLCSLAAAGAAGAWPAVAAAQQAVVLTRAIPSSGEAVPLVGMGTWITFNVGNDRAARDSCAEVMRAFFAAGGRMIDSSPMYASSQDVIGYGLAKLGKPAALFSAEKVWISSGAHGSPQDQIQALRAFQISQEFQDRFGYAPLTPQVKADIFGLNAAPLYGVDPIQRRRGSLDALDRMKAEYRHAPEPSFATLGPRDAAEWRRFRKHHGSRPG